VSPSKRQVRPSEQGLSPSGSDLDPYPPNYPVNHFTLCGIDQAAVDFDGNWWDLLPGSAEGQFGFAFTRGTMTLMPNGTTVFRARSEARARFVRHSGPIRQPGCY
jgi:hypothetical protein